MKIVEINTVTNGSTGKIMLQIANCVNQTGGEAYTFSTNVFSSRYHRLPEPPVNHCYYGTFFENAIHFVLGRYFGLNGLGSCFSTYRLIRKIKQIQPKVIHLHNLHAYCINLWILLNYLKKNDTPVILTLHDCWAFTGQCSYFNMVKCEKWKTGCHDCVQHNNAYPVSAIDSSCMMWKLKKKWFSGLNRLIIVTPSKWLADLVEQSFLKDYPVKVINNGINLSIFKPLESDFRKKYNCEAKFLILGVAFNWGVRKGLDIFIELACRLGAQYQIVLVGTDKNVDINLPQNIISIHKTQSQTELAEIYTAADLFVNPTREENYPTVNMEALACGTPVLTFETGGSPEILDETCGVVVEYNDIDKMEQEIIRICEEKPFSKEACLTKAKNFNMNNKFKEYIELYENCTHSSECPI